MVHKRNFYTRIESLSHYIVLAQDRREVEVFCARRGILPDVLNSGKRSRHSSFARHLDLPCRYLSRCAARLKRSTCCLQARSSTVRSAPLAADFKQQRRVEDSVALVARLARKIELCGEHRLVRRLELQVKMPGAAGIEAGHESSRTRSARRRPVNWWPRSRKPSLSYSPASLACQSSTSAPATGWQDARQHEAGERDRRSRPFRFRATSPVPANSA